MGVMNLESLRAEDKSWSALASPLYVQVRQIINAAAKVTVSNGEKCYFWLDKWINGKTVELEERSLRHYKTVDGWRTSRNR